MIVFYVIITLLFTTCSKQQNPSSVDLTGTQDTTTLKSLNSSVLVGTPIEFNLSSNESKYVTTLKAEFNTGQSIWYCKGGWLGADSFNLTRLNSTVNWLKDNDQSPVVHMLLGQDLYMPEWLTEQTWDSTALDNMMRNMLNTIMDANDNKNKVDVWNVINEVFEEDGCYRNNLLWAQMGWEEDASELSGDERINSKHPIFIRKAFEYCREKTANKLELRDYDIETDNPVYEQSKKHKAFYQLVKHMLNSNIPIDAVGIQGHLKVGKNSWRLDNDALKKTIQKFKDLGVEVYITELDASIDDLKWSDEVALKQKEDYYNYIKQAIEGGANRLFFWGIQDGMDKGWLPDKYPLPWDANLNKKPAYFGVKQALMDTNSK